MPDNHPQDEHTYVIEAENAAEMARLVKQDRLITKEMGGLFPQRADLSNIHSILDIACGPGGWALDVARAYPNKEVVGVDISQLMIEYARQIAREKELNNASFQVMDILKPLDFADNIFDWINARLLFAFMPPSAWPHLLQECMRICRPGGIIRLTECEMAISNSQAMEQMSAMITRAFVAARKSFSHDSKNIGITAMLGRFLRDAGCQDIQKAAFAIDFSKGTEAHAAVFQDFMVSAKLIQPFLVKLGITTQEEVDLIYQRMIGEMHTDDFCALWFYFSSWGTKPQ